jgi:hypothetical protein
MKFWHINKSDPVRVIKQGQNDYIWRGIYRVRNNKLLIGGGESDKKITLWLNKTSKKKKKIKSWDLKEPSRDFLLMKNKNLFISASELNLKKLNFFSSL